jgi:hypothetical protein
MDRVAISMESASLPSSASPKSYSSISHAHAGLLADAPLERFSASSVPELNSAPQGNLPAGLNRPTVERDQRISRSAFAGLMAGGCHV